MPNNLNHICFYGGGVGIDLSKLHEMKLKQPPKTQYKMKTSLDQFIELLVKFRDENPGSGDKPVMIENIDAPGIFNEMSYFQPNGIERIVSFSGDLVAISIGAGEVWHHAHYKDTIVSKWKHMEQYTLTIPEDILFSDSLTPTDKLVYGLLHSQDKPSVKQISKIVNRSERTIWRAKKKYTNTDIHVTKETLTTDTYVSDTNVSTDTDVTPPTDTDVSDTYVSVKDTIEHYNNVNKVLKFIKTLTSQETYNEKRKRILEIYTHKELFTDEDFALFDEKIDEMRSKFEEM